MSTERDKTNLTGFPVTRRHFMAVSTMASVCALSKTAIADGIYRIHDSRPFVAKIITADGWRGEIELLQRIRRTLACLIHQN